jgi:type II secretory pathway pseudopilin PulG
VVIAILGILATTAMPFYQTWTQRAYGTQATALARQLVDAQIMNYLQNNSFIPDEGQTLSIFRNSDPSSAEVQSIVNGLKVSLPLDRKFDYTFWNDPLDPEGKCVGMMIRADFPLFKDGQQYIIVKVFNDGRFTYF